MKRLLIWGMSLAVVSLPNFSMAQNGDAYRLLGNSIRVDRVSHWENWNYQNDLVASLNVPINKADIFQVEAGGLRPVFFRRNLNVALGANNFTYPDLVRAGGDLTIGGATAQSNAAFANNVLDGDLSTYWEPKPRAIMPVVWTTQVTLISMGLASGNSKLIWPELSTATV